MRTTLLTRTHDSLRFIGITFFGSLLMALAAKVTVPTGLVKISLHPLLPMLFGLMFGSRVATASILLYLTEGLMGFPVFQSPGAGLSYMMGPTFGYLIGFVAEAYLAGRTKEAGLLNRNLLISGLVLVAIYHVKFILGLSWLSYLKQFMGLPISSVIHAGYTLFIYNTVAHLLILFGYTTYKR